MSKKNFVLFDGNPKFTFGGGQRVSIDVLESLQNSHRCYLVEIGRTPVFFKRSCPFLQGSLRLPFPFTISRTFEVITFPVFWTIGFFQLLYFLKKNNLMPENTVLYSASKKSHLFLFFLKLLFRYSVIAHIQTIDSPYKFSTLILAQILKYFDQVWGTSPLQKEIYPEIHFHILPIAAKEISTQPKDLPKGKIVVATLSSLIDIKGIADFVASYDYLKDPEKFEYWVLGDGPQRPFLEKKAPREIKFKGFQENPVEILKYHVHIFVFPTVIPEAFGLSLLEAFSMGIPSVTTNIGHQNILANEFQGRSGIPIHSPQRIAEEIENLASDCAEYSSLSAQLLTRSRSYDLPRFSRLISERLNQL